jgi:hypothetical protein
LTKTNKCVIILNRALEEGDIMSNLKSISVKPVFEYSHTYNIMRSSTESGKSNYEFPRITNSCQKEEVVNNYSGFTLKRKK